MVVAPPPPPLDPLISMVFGHDLKSGKTVGVMLPWIFWNVNSNMIGKLSLLVVLMLSFLQ